MTEHGPMMDIEGEIGIWSGRFDVRSADGTSIAVWVEGDRNGAGDGPRLDRGPHYLRIVRRRAP